MKKDTEDITAKKKFMTCKDKRKNLSRMQRKVWFVISYHLLVVHAKVYLYYFLMLVIWLPWQV